MKPFSPFEHRRDAELGQTLRDLLTPEDHEAFLAKVLEGARGIIAESEQPMDWWDVLGAWARPGIAAAVAVIIASTFGIRQSQAADEFDLDPLSHVTVTAEEESLLLSPNPPDVEFLLTSSFEN